MAVNPMVSSGAAALERSRSQLDDAAQKLASSSNRRDAVAEAQSDKPLAASETPSGSPDQAEALASVQVYARQVQAAAKVVETADATIGFLLDTHA